MKEVLEIIYFVRDMNGTAISE